MRGALLLLLVASCGAIDSEGFYGKVTDARCDYLVRCKAVANAADCHAYFDRTAIDTHNLDAAIENDTVEYDSDTAEDCIDAYRDLSCDLAEQVDALAACDDVFAGTIPNGYPCVIDLECTSGVCVTFACDDACCPGECMPPNPQPAIDEPCTTFCVEGAYCGADSICHAYLPKGAACDGNSICGYGLYCAGAPAGGSGVCKVLPQQGEMCEGPCATEGLLCIGGTCQPAGLRGDPCSTDDDCSSFYACTVEGICGSYPALGEMCQELCSGNAYCESGTCVAQKASGSTCTYNIECKSHFCDSHDICSMPPLCF
jgi:hypothetical protein